MLHLYKAFVVIICQHIYYHITSKKFICWLKYNYPLDFLKNNVLRITWNNQILEPSERAGQTRAQGQNFASGVGPSQRRPYVSANGIDFTCKQRARSFCKCKADKYGSCVFFWNYIGLKKLYTIKTGSLSPFQSMIKLDLG